MKLMALAAKDAGISTSGTVAEMLKLQQSGSLISEKVLPHFGRRMREAAQANGGLNAALNSNRVAMNRFLFSLSEAADLIFKSGFSKGLSELFNTSADSIVTLRDLWQGLGAILGSIFHIIAKGVKAVTPTLAAFGSILKGITDMLGESYSWILSITAASGILYKVFSKFALLSRSVPIIGVLTTILMLIKEAAFWGEELMNLYTQDKIGVLFDPRKSNNNITENVASKMLGGTESGTGLMASLMNLFSSRNMGQFVSRAIGEGSLLGSKMGQPFIIQGTVSIDGEQAGRILSESSAVQNTIDTKISQATQ